MESQDQQGETRAQAQEPDFIVDRQGRVMPFRRQDAGQTQAGSGGQVPGSRPRPASQYRVVMLPIGLFMSVIMLIITSIGNFTTPDGRARRAFDAGNNAFHTFSYSQAIDEYDQAIRLKPAFGEAFFNRGLAYQAKGDDERALADFDQAVKCMPSSSDAYASRGLAYRAIGEYDKAIADFGQALEHEYIADERAAAYDNRGIAYCYKEDYAQAIADFDTAIRATVENRLNLPPDPEPDEADTVDQRIDERLTIAQSFRAELSLVYAHRGLAYLSIDNLDKALSDLDRAIKLQPALALPYYLAGCCLSRLRRR